MCLWKRKKVVFVKAVFDLALVNGGGNGQEEAKASFNGMASGIRQDVTQSHIARDIEKREENLIIKSTMYILLLPHYAIIWIDHRLIVAIIVLVLFSCL